SKVFRNPDQGYQINREDCRRMRNSLVIMQPLKSRFMATAHLPWHIEPEDAHDEQQQQIARQLTRIVDDTPEALQRKLWLLEAADFFLPDQAGSKHGLGLRHYLFYPWRLMQDTLGMLHEFVERVGLGTTIWRYATGNPQDEQATKEAATNQAFNNVILLPGKN